MLQKLRIGIFSLSGNVGKTTLASQILYPRLINPVLYEVETYNQGASGLKGIRVEKRDGSQFAEIYERTFGDESIIVDVGASNVERFLDELRRYHGVTEIFDLFVVPTTTDVKAIADTLSSIAVLKRFGIPNNRIRVVFNRFEGGNLAESYRKLWDAHKTPEYAFDWDERLFVMETAIFADLVPLNETIASMLGEARTEEQFKALLAASHNSIGKASGAKKVMAIKHDLALRQAIRVNGTLDTFFEALVNGLPVEKGQG